MNRKILCVIMAVVCILGMNIVPADASGSLTQVAYRMAAKNNGVMPLLDERVTINVPVFEQENKDYCGPATVKQVIHYINGSSLTQSDYANALGTIIGEGTNFTNIPGVLNAAVGAGTYVYDENVSDSFSNWCTELVSSIYYDKPALLDINTISVSSFPYNSGGHIVNVSGYEYGTNEDYFRITDPYGPGLGNRWYTMSDLYAANRAHWRHAIIRLDD